MLKVGRATGPILWTANDAKSYPHYTNYPQADSALRESESRSASNCAGQRTDRKREESETTQTAEKMMKSARIESDKKRGASPGEEARGGSRTHFPRGQSCGT